MVIECEKDQLDLEKMEELVTEELDSFSRINESIEIKIRSVDLDAVDLCHSFYFKNSMIPPLSFSKVANLMEYIEDSNLKKEVLKNLM
jgi:hypothetical protein